MAIAREERIGKQVMEMREVTTEQLNRIARERRAFEESIQDLSQDIEKQKCRMVSSINALLDPTNQDAEAQVLTERTRLKQLSESLAEAQGKLQAFNEVNPTAEEVARRQKAIEDEADQRARQQMRERFAENLRKRIQLLKEVESLEVQANEIYAESSIWAYARAADNAYAGIAFALTNLVPANYWKFDQRAYGVPIFGDRLREAGEWLKKWGFPTDQAT